MGLENGNKENGNGNRSAAAEIPKKKSAFVSLKKSMKELFFSDDPFRQFKNQKSTTKAILALQYIFPILQWIPSYNLSLFKSDVIAGITIATLAVPQGISYAKLGNLPPVLGLYSSFVPPLIYTVMGCSREMAIGTTAIVAVLMSCILGNVASPTQEPQLYLQLVFTTTFFSGIFQATLGIFRLGFILDFLSQATLAGFMSGVATTICLQQLKGIFGLNNFTNKTDVVSVLHSAFSDVHNWRWESAVFALYCLIILSTTKLLAYKKPKLFLVSALAPLCTLILGTVSVYFTHGEKHGIPILGELKKGLNSSTLHMLTFSSKHLAEVLKASLIISIVSLTEGIAIGRSFALLKRYQLNGNKEMIAIGTMNIIGSLTNCCVSSGVLSRTAVNYNAGCRTAIPNVIMAIVIMITLLFLTPLFYYTPNVVLSSILVVALVPMIDVQGAIRFWKMDKFDFVICISSFLGVVFQSVPVGLLVGVGLSVLRVLFHVMRPEVVTVGNIPGTAIYRSTEQYSQASRLPSFLILSIEAPIYFASSVYLQDRITRWVTDEDEFQKTEFNEKLRFLVLDLTSSTSIDSSGVGALIEIKRSLEVLDIQLVLANPNRKVMERLHASNFLRDVLSEDWLFLTVAEAVSVCITRRSEIEMEEPF